MTADDFRRLALALPEAEESAHMHHPDFRVRNKIFATLGYPEAGWGVVKLTAEQQRAVVTAEPRAFAPAQGAWGRAGMTCVRLSQARRPTVRGLLVEAWCNAAPRSLVEHHFPPAAPSRPPRRKRGARI